MRASGPEFDIVTKELQNKMDVRSTNRWNLPQIILNIYLNFKMIQGVTKK